MGRISIVLPVMLATFACRGLEAADRIKAPPLDGADAWLNTDGGKALSLADLRGQVVLLDFWTYCCINCMHVFPDLHYLEHKYAGQPLVVIGVHSGKFEEEKDADHIRQAILRHNITHPVAVDSQYRIWNAYNVPGWPTLVLIDSQGNLVAGWSGEGHRDEIDAKIHELLELGRQNKTLAQPLHFTSEQSTFKAGVLDFPGKVLADAPHGRLFISDTNHNRVLVADLKGKVSQVIGGSATGLKDGRFHDAEFHQPQGFALSADGSTLYIADTENHALRSADLEHATVTTIAGTGAQARRAPTNGDPHATPLSSPWDLVRVGDKLYIAMAGVHQIWVMDLKNKTLSVFAGTGREGAVDGRNSDAGFAQPSGLATDGHELYVADSEASSIRAVSLDAKDDTTRTLAGSGDLFGFGRRDGVGNAARFQHPLGVALHDGTLFVADTFNGQIRQIDVQTAAVTTFVGSGASDLGTDASPNFYEPGGISATADTLYVADTNHHRIVAVNLATRKASVLAIELPTR